MCGAPELFGSSQPGCGAGSRILTTHRCNRSGDQTGPEVDPGCGLSNIIDDSSLTGPVTSVQFVLVS